MVAPDLGAMSGDWPDAPLYYVTDAAEEAVAMTETPPVPIQYKGQPVQFRGLFGYGGAGQLYLDGRFTEAQEGVVVVDPPKLPAKRDLFIGLHETIASIAVEAAGRAAGKKSLFFCQSRSVTEAVAEHMRRAGTAVFVHHSAVSLEERTLAEERFHHGTDACIVCTSTLELGIDVGDLDRVLQHEAPDTVSSFLQRMGRTGRRAGQVANTTFFCETGDGVVQAVALVELAKTGWVEPVELSDRCWPVLVHQLLAMSLAEAGVPPEQAWAHLSQLPDCRGIHRAEFDRLIAWMVRDQAVVLLDGRLLIGPKVERRFGRRIETIVRSPDQWSALMVANPFVDEARKDPSRLLLMVMKAGIRHEGVEALRAQLGPRAA